MNFSKKETRFFSAADEAILVASIREAEKNTSGEIRVHTEPVCTSIAFDRALEVFGALDMHKTAARNGVLFYLATTSKKFAIVADEGINNVVADDFWDIIRDSMRHHFATGNFVAGLQAGITTTGEALKSYFPYQKDDTNELPDEISLG